MRAEAVDHCAQALASFFGNPLVGILGALASIVGLILAVFFYMEARETPELTYRVHPVRTSVVKVGEASELSISHRGKQISGNVSAAQVALWNAGERPIREDDILSPVEISTVGGQTILEAKIRKTSRALVGLKIETSALNQGKVKVSWCILEKGDGVIIQLIYAGDQDVALRVTGSVVGQSEPVELAYSGKLRSPEEQYAKNVRVDRIVAFVFLAGALLIFLFWLLLVRKLNSSRLASIAVVLPRAILVSVVAYLAIGLWMLYCSWQSGPPFGF